MRQLLPRGVLYKVYVVTNAALPRAQGGVHWDSPFGSEAGALHCDTGRTYSILMWERWWRG